MHITSSLSTYLLMSTWVVSTSWLLWIMLKWTQRCDLFFDILFSCPLDIHSDVGTLDNMLVLFLIFWWYSTLFSIVAATIYIPIYKACRLSSLHILTDIISCLFKAAVLTGVKWYFTVDMICISLMICNVEHVFMFLLAICMGFPEKYLARSSVYFKIRLFGFCCFYCWVVWVVYKFWTLTTLIW